jgi:hypothetical protein
MMKEAGVLPLCRWVGKINVQAVGNIYDEEGELAFAFTESKDGSVNGGAHFRRTANRPKRLGDCTLIRKYSADEVDLSITGRREGDHFTLAIGPGTTPIMGTLAVSVSGNCRNGSGSAPAAAGLLGPLAEFAESPLVVEAKDGVIDHFYHETVGEMTSDATIELHDAQRK